LKSFAMFTIPNPQRDVARFEDLGSLCRQNISSGIDKK